jgi:predicted DsbA family dithiol-disulfide isomerase
LASLPTQPADAEGRRPPQGISHRQVWKLGKGRDIRNRQTLLDEVAEAGLDRGEAMLNSDEGLEEIKVAQRFGVDGVPFFIINGKFALAGAQPSDAFLAAFRALGPK